MPKCENCAFYSQGECTCAAADSDQFERGGRGCDEFVEYEDCGFGDEDLGIDQDEPWF